MFDPYNMKTQIFLQKLKQPLPSLYLKNIPKRILLFISGCLIMLQAQSQIDKRLAMADDYFAAGDYFTAAGLYGQFLHPAVFEAIQ